MSLRLLIPTIGTRGDLQPYIALALVLDAAGYQTTIATHPAMRSLVEFYGIRFAPIGSDIDIGIKTAAIRAHSPNWLLGFWRVMRFSFDMLESAHDDLLALCRQTDCVLVSHTAAGSIEADQLGVPTLSATLFPQAIPVHDPDASPLKRVFDRLAGAAMGWMMTRPLNQIRRKFGVVKMGEYGITSPRLNLIAVSPHVFPPNPLWEPRHHMTGYWIAPAPQQWEPDHALTAFLDEGEPPIVISLGAMALGESDARQSAQIALAAIQQAGVRAIIQGWDEAFQRIELPAAIFHGGSIPHDWLLPRCSGLGHHGGFGTTAAGFRAGIPQVVIPHIIDQFIWGQRAFELGVSVNPIPRAKLTSHSLADALCAIQADEGMKKQAGALGAKISSENGVQKAVELIQKTVENQPSE